MDRFQLATLRKTRPADLRQRIEIANRHPWCNANAPGPQPGEVAGLTVHKDAAGNVDSAHLWCLRPAKDGSTTDTPLVEDAKRDAASAISRATLVSPFIARSLPELRQAPTVWQADLIAWSGPTWPNLPSIDGTSFGLALVLAGVSWALDLPVPRNFVATGAIDRRYPDLLVTGVGGIHQKLCITCDAALSVDTVLVSAHGEHAGGPTDAALADAAIKTWCPDGRVRVRAVRSAAEAVSNVFPAAPVAALLRSKWRDRGSELVRRVHSIAQEPHVPQLKSWRGIAETAGVAASLVKPDSTDWHRGRLAESIARRHEGAGDVGIEWPTGEQLGRLLPQRRFELLAQVVQASAVAEPGRASDFASRAIELLPTTRDLDAHAILLGASGRAFAAAGKYADAERALLEAINLWARLERLHQASIPVCELVRVRALSGAELEDANGTVERVRSALEEDRQLASLLWFRLALGRAHVLRGDQDLAARELGEHSPGEWNIDGTSRSDLSLCRLRWLARANPGEGAAARQTLRAARQASPAVAILASLDEVRADSTRLDEEIDKLRDDPVYQALEARAKALVAALLGLEVSTALLDHLPE